MQRRSTSNIHILSAFTEHLAKVNIKAEQAWESI